MVVVSHDSVRVVANIFISFIGAGVLGLPYAFKQAGLLEGLIVMCTVSYCSVKAMLLLIDCKHKVQSVLANDGGPLRVNRGKEYAKLDVEDSDVVTCTSDDINYSDVGFAAFGHCGRYVIDGALLISQVGFCCAYLIFITENLANHFDSVAKNQWLIMLLPPLFFLTLIPDLSKLAVFSLFAQISNLFAFAVVFWFDFDHLHLASTKHRKEFSIKGFPFFFSIAIYCFEGAGMILSLEQSVPDQLRASFRRLFVTTITCVTALYVTFGASGYLSFGPETKDIITLNLPNTSGLDFAFLVKLCLCVSLFFTYPVMLFPVTALIQQRLSHSVGIDKDGKFVPLCIRFILVTLTGVVVLLVPRFADLMALIGATCCTLLAFIMPALCHLALFRKEVNVSQHSVDIALVCVGILGAILGTLDAVKNVVHAK